MDHLGVRVEDVAIRARNLMHGGVHDRAQDVTLCVAEQRAQGIYPVAKSLREQPLHFIDVGLSERLK
jgi:hypothetical protein